MTMTKCAAALLTGLLASAAIAASDTSLTVEFTGVETKQGAILLAVYDSEATWSSGKAAHVAMADASGAAVRSEIASLTPGRYGIKAFHDLDNDGQMDVNPFGMPIEPFAFSNDAVGERGPASWADAAFEVRAGTNAQRITIR